MSQERFAPTCAIPVTADERRYAELTYDLIVAVAQARVRLNPEMSVVYVSDQGTDSTWGRPRDAGA